MAGSARDEAERLVATLLARAATAGVSAAARSRRNSGSGGVVSDAAGLIGNTVDGLFGALNDAARGQESTRPGGAWATGSPECCVCPVCRAIAATRDPSPETVFKIATGAGEIATGAAGVLRGLASLAGSLQGERPRKSPGGGAERHAPAPDEAWSAATRSARSAPSQAGPGTRTTAPDPATGTSAPEPAAGTAESAAGAGAKPAAGAGAKTAAGAGAKPATEAPDPNADPWAAATAASAREAEEARARARAAEEAVAKAVAEARRVATRKIATEAAKKEAATGPAEAAEKEAATGPAEGAGKEAATGPAEAASEDVTAAAPVVPENGTNPAAARKRPVKRAPRAGSDVWSVVTAEAAADGAAPTRSVDHELGASASEDHDVTPGDGARDGDAV